MIMKTIKCLLFLLLIINITSCAKEEYDFYATINGTVIDEISSEPVEGASVNLTPGGKNCITDIQGHFSFNELEAIQYTITVQKNGYSTNRKGINAIAGETSDISVTIEKMN